MHTTRNEHSPRHRDPELELLVARCQLGEPSAFDALVERWHEPLWRYVHGMTGDPVRSEEILQEGWLRILRGIGALRDPQRLGAWMFSIVRRTFVDGLRARYAAPRFEPLDAEPPADDAEPQLDWQESESLHWALQRLPPPDRETVVLFYLRELDLRQVADVLDVPVGTVKSRLHRGRRTLRRELETQGVSR
jgi:RNA polymerase sigma-70 factor (ECF subfamily)